MSENKISIWYHRHLCNNPLTLKPTHENIIAQHSFQIIICCQFSSYCGVWFGTWLDLASEVRKKRRKTVYRIAYFILMPAGGFQWNLEALIDIMFKIIQLLIFCYFQFSTQVIHRCMLILILQNRKLGEWTGLILICRNCYELRYINIFFLLSPLINSRNDRFNLSDGVVGLSFDVESRTVYFQPLATDR